MFYQPIVLTKDLYAAYNRSLSDFPLHWHSEFEIVYCAEGQFSAQIEESRYVVYAGDILFIGSALPHSYFDCSPDNQITLARGGSVFFGNRLFTEIAKKFFASPVLRQHEETVSLFKRVSEICADRNLMEISSENRLEAHGLIFMIVANLLRHLPQGEGGVRRDKRLQYVLNIQKTLEFVSVNYNQEITVESAAKISGYEKSAFCRIFKQATDTSFHQYLSQYRIKMACMLLAESDKTVSEVAEKTGFGELKTFCRVFKQIMGMTPSEYRQSKSAN
ncbi:MAG: AraC family transcriptional regulator [Clostridia bacterium]|nr:helix-turn-helix domain-containing protein [Oscillospiraceae bacterium]MBQ7032581.1 AraC family transcriptional regulator [Clostridia bacterium]